MKRLPLNVWRLAIAQPLVLSVASLNVFVGGIIGSKLAPSPQWATVPIGCLTLGTALSVVPVTLLMKSLGRKLAIQLIVASSIGVAALACYALSIQSFTLFCVATFFFGTTTANSMQFRFAAMESVPAADSARAASAILVGGIFTALIGPQIALLGRNLFPWEFSGSFFIQGLLFLAALCILWPFKNTEPSDIQSTKPPRPLRTIAKQSVFWLAIVNAATGYAIMSYIMTATPVSMHVMHGHSLEDTKWVIQSHILAMYLPSLIAAWTIRKLGLKKMMLLGSLSYAVCIGIALLGEQWIHYWFALVLLGVGWNFMFIGGTTLLPRSYHPNERYKVQGFNEAIVFGMQATAAFTSGWMIFSWGWRALLMSTLPLLFLQAFLTFRFREPKIFASKG